MSENSLYNNTFLPEATQCNFGDLQVYGPFQGSYDEPSSYEMQNLELEVLHIRDLLLSDSIIDDFCKQIFNYRIAKAQSFIKNIYDFLQVILYKEVKFTYSPQFGINLWPGALSYVRLQSIEQIVAKKVSLFFMDYITETTTFLRYHIKFRFNSVFNNNFRRAFCQQVIKCLLHFSQSIDKLHTMKTGIETALLLLLINHSRQGEQH